MIEIYWRFENIPRSWLTEQFLAVPTFHIKLVFTRVPKSLAAIQECSAIHEGYEYTRKRFWLSTCPTNAQGITQWFEEIWQLHREIREDKIEKSGSAEPLQSILLPCFSVGAREKGLDDRNCPMSMTNHAAGIGTCTQSGMTIPSHPSSEMRLGKFPDHTDFQSWIVNFRVEVCANAKNPALAA